MGKNIRQKHNTGPKRAGLRHTKPVPERLAQQKQKQNQKQKGKHNPRTQVTTTTVPYDTTDRILLLGEGDFSFSRSLVQTHKCMRVHATSFDSRATVLAKYPQAADHFDAIEAFPSCTIQHDVDATKLAKCAKIRKGGWDRVIFNFPHVGGLSKDVNRQVRSNQEMIVGFLKSAESLLSEQGTIIVTLFDGEPYELWNIRNLARHAGLQVRQSFKFSAHLYPEYKHARTLGNIDGEGAWRGEDRPARTYVFCRPASDMLAQRMEKRKPVDSDAESAADSA